jgi:hypothetical protein
MSMSLKNDVFWDVAPCRSCVNRRFRGMCSLHLQSRKIRERGTSLSRWLHVGNRSISNKSIKVLGRVGVINLTQDIGQLWGL